MKFSNQAIALIGILTTIIGYLMLTDFQAIAYDPCTEYSPFHHPEQFRNQSMNSLPLSTHNSFKLSLNIHPRIRMLLGENRTMDWDTQFNVWYICEKVVFCKSNINIPTIDLHFQNLLAGEIQDSLLSCHIPVSYDFNSKPSFCINLIEGKSSDVSATIQTLVVLPDDIYTKASNSCMTALDGQCHWIPFSTVTRKKCKDCPPICRGKHQTLSLAQIVIGLSILILTNLFKWIPLLAMISNQLSNNRRISVGIFLFIKFQCN